MRVLVLMPHHPVGMSAFTAGLLDAGAEVYALGDMDDSRVPEKLRARLAGYLRVDSFADEENVGRAAERFLRDTPVDRVETMWEPLVVLAGALRERLGARGMNRETALGFRDKDLMKQRVRAAGLRVPHSRRVRSGEDVYAAAEVIGFPVVIKPIEGVCSVDTYRLNSRAEIDAVLPQMAHLREGNVEEFIEGEEFTFDAIVRDGEVLFDSVNQYHPPLLLARQHDWISPADFTFRDPHAVPKLTGGLHLGRGVVKALGLDTGFVHMEWFLTPKGEAVFGEIAARNGGGGLIDLANFANDISLYREWGQTLVHGRMSDKPSRRHHVAMVCKRAEGTGRIRHIAGLDAVRQRCGNAMIVESIRKPGEEKNDKRGDYAGDGFCIVRHEDMHECLAMMQALINDLRIYAGQGCPP